MSEAAVSALYDALETFESARRPGEAYPVHKVLQLDAAEDRDIYDWLVDTVGLAANSHVLDAGCGVGFGALKLAERGASRVTGISLSANEIAAARDAAARSRRALGVEFHQASFDELPGAGYDLILAVESLKHSPRLDVTLRSLRGALTPGGRIAIVEDVYKGPANDRTARYLRNDWHLARLYRESDYLAALGAANCRTIDLTAGVRLSNPLSRATRRAALALLLPCVGRSTATAVRAFRGGLHLEALYARRRMAYKLILYDPAGRTAQ